MNINTTNIHTNNYISGSVKNQDQLGHPEIQLHLHKAHNIPIRPTNIGEGQESQEQLTAYAVGARLGSQSRDQRQSQKEVFTRTSHNVNAGPASFGGPYGSFLPPAVGIAQYNTSQNDALNQSSYDGGWQQQDYIYKTRSRLNKQIDPMKTTDSFKRSTARGALNHSREQ